MAYKNVAFIPARGGSKSIPLKNIKLINGRPLIYWTLRAAQECKYIDMICVSTDSLEIKDTVDKFGFEKVKVIGRSDETATDTASTESVMLEFAEKETFENIVLIQATSPLLSESDLDKGFECFVRDNVDSVMSVVRQKRFIWKENLDKGINPVNYDVFNRPRRQEFEGFLVENGAFYITSKKNLLKSKNRVSGNIAAVEMDENSYFEIDEPGDWVIVEKLLSRRYPQIDKDIRSEIKLFLTDCDGCLTDGGMYYLENGEEMKKFNALDGMGFSFLRAQGILTGIVTGETVELNRRRAEKLKVDFYEAGCKNKYQKICEICRENNIALGQVAYVGDDINDLEAVEKVGFGCSVANGLESVKRAAKYVSVRNGGNGAVREIIDFILKGRSI